jgi:hypothetical protein
MVVISRNGARATSLSFQHENVAHLLNAGVHTLSRRGACLRTFTLGAATPGDAEVQPEHVAGVVDSLELGEPRVIGGVVGRADPVGVGVAGSEEVQGPSARAPWSQCRVQQLVGASDLDQLAVDAED